MPVVRGAGVFQAGVDFCVDVLSNKGWVHVFPEGRVTKSPIRIKWGISRLIYESKIPPILLPIWIEGMQDVWTERSPYYPRFGKVISYFNALLIYSTFRQWKSQLENLLI